MAHPGESLVICSIELFSVGLKPSPLVANSCDCSRVRVFQFQAPQETVAANGQQKVASVNQASNKGIAASADRAGFIASHDAVSNAHKLRSGLLHLMIARSSMVGMNATGCGESSPPPPPPWSR